MTIEGTNPSLPSILLNSHTDVVPVFPVSLYMLIGEELCVMSKAIDDLIQNRLLYLFVKFQG